MRPLFFMMYQHMQKTWVTTRSPSMRKGSSWKVQVSVFLSLYIFQLQGLKNRLEQGIPTYSQTSLQTLTFPRQGYEPMTSLLLALSLIISVAHSDQTINQFSDNFQPSQQSYGITRGFQLKLLSHRNIIKYMDCNIMKANTKDQLISEQIDVVIIGSRSFELLQILLDQDLELIPMPKLKNKYLSSLESLYPEDSYLSFHRPAKFPAGLPESKIQKYTTNLLTQSFWLQFNFFYFGAISHDPILASITRGHISTCIVVSSEHETDSGEFKKLITKQSSETTTRMVDPHESSKAANAREELIIEQKIINSLHNFKLNEFSSVLTLKMIDKNRIIEGSSNIKLNRNQILRWIVDRYFENEFGIKLNADVGDEIENYHEIPNESYCRLM